MDQSVAHSGICLRWGIDDYTVSNFKTKPADWRDNPVGRKLHIERHIKKLIEDNDVSLFLMEDYARQVKNSSSFIPLVELGGTIKRAVFLKKVPMLVIGISQLKKFATGKGNTKKPAIIKEVYKRWKFDTNNDNESDAFVIALIGYHYEQAIKAKNPLKYIESVPGLIAPQREVLVSLLNRKAEKENE